LSGRTGASLGLAGVSVAYGSRFALRDVDLDVRPGEIVGMIGLSGAGKTSLLRLFNGMVRPAAGRVHVLGNPLDTLGSGALRALRARVAFIHQELCLVGNLSALQNVLMGRLGRTRLLPSVRMLTLPKKSDVLDVHRLLERVGIGGRLYDRVDRLSGGERQRVAIARALFQQPSVLLADEPVSSVDPARARSVLDLLTGLARERDLTLLVSLHSLSLARECFPRLVGMQDGRIVFDRATQEVPEEAFESLFRLE
jgi:phosphonate transport system ATP-binding protein